MKPETFSFPDDFKLTLVKGDGSSQFSQSELDGLLLKSIGLRSPVG